MERVFISLREAAALAAEIESADRAQKLTRELLGGAVRRVARLANGEAVSVGTEWIRRHLDTFERHGLDAAEFVRSHADVPEFQDIVLRTPSLLGALPPAERDQFVETHAPASYRPNLDWALAARAAGCSREAIAVAVLAALNLPPPLKQPPTTVKLLRCPAILELLNAHELEAAARCALLDATATLLETLPTIAPRLPESAAADLRLRAISLLTDCRGLRLETLLALPEATQVVIAEKISPPRDGVGAALLLACAARKGLVDEKMGISWLRKRLKHGLSIWTVPAIITAIGRSGPYPEWIQALLRAELARHGYGFGTVIKRFHRDKPIYEVHLELKIFVRDPDYSWDQISEGDTACFLIRDGELVGSNHASNPPRKVYLVPFYRFKSAETADKNA